MLYSAVLVSTVHQNEIAIHKHISPHFLISFPNFHSALSRVLSAIQYVLISYIFIHSINSINFLSKNKTNKQKKNKGYKVHFVVFSVTKSI